MDTMKMDAKEQKSNTILVNNLIHRFLAQIIF